MRSRTKEEITEEIEELEERKKSLEDGDNEDAYDEMLNDVYGEINVCGYQYEASRVLKECDETAYRCGLLDYNDSELSEIEDQLNDLREELKELGAE